jgi:hypothetical protein
MVTILEPWTRGYAEKSSASSVKAWGRPLESAVVYQQLLEEGLEVPGCQMSATLNTFKV